MSRVTFPKQLYTAKLKSPVTSSQGLAFSLDSRRLYVSTVRDGVMCIDLKSKRRKQVKGLGPSFYAMVPKHSASPWVNDPDDVPQECQVFDGGPDLSAMKIESYAVSPDRTFVVVLGRSGFTEDTRGRLKILDLPSLKVRCQIEGYRRGTAPPIIGISADGSLIVVSDWPDRAYVRRSCDGSKVLDLTAFGESITGCTVSANGRLLATSCLIENSRHSGRGIWVADLAADEQTPPAPVKERFFLTSRSNSRRRPRPWRR